MAVRAAVLQLYLSNQQVHLYQYDEQILFAQQQPVETKNVLYKKVII